MVFVIVEEKIQFEAAQKKKKGGGRETMKTKGKGSSKKNGREL